MLSFLQTLSKEEAQLSEAFRELRGKQGWRTLGFYEVLTTGMVRLSHSCALAVRVGVTTAAASTEQALRHKWLCCIHLNAGPVQ